MKNLLLILIPFLVFICACRENKTQFPDSTEINFLQEGQKIAAISFGVLGGRLQNALAEGDVPYAIQYCNLAAMPIMDSLSQAHNVSIKRTSLKPRNSKNAPTVEERSTLELFEKQLQKGNKLTPITKPFGKSDQVFYAPIFVNDLCLKCHGERGTTLSEENYAHILDKYPNDKAVDYKVGDLRGMWSITFYSKKIIR